jgi:NADPH:quinone reductase-like Zn-dependent oxidoreductase
MEPRVVWAPSRSRLPNHSERKSLPFAAPGMWTERSLGADHVLDYTKEDFTQSGQHYDLILGANAYHSIFDYRRALSQNGIYVMAGGAGGLLPMLQTMLLVPWLSLIRTKKICFFLAEINQKDLVFLKDLLATGRVAPAIDSCYPLSDAAEAIRYLEEGHGSRINR